MKRFARILALVLALSLFTCSALAAGKMTVSQENFHVTDTYSVYGYALAKVENTGDKPVGFSAGLLEIYDANGDTLTSTDYLNCYPSCLQPGEYGYIYAYDNIEDASSNADVDDYALTVTGKSSENEVTRFPASGSYEANVQTSAYSTENLVTVEVTNDSDATVFDMIVVMVITDDAGNVLYMDTERFYSSVGINAGSTVTVRSSVGKDWTDAWEREGVTPAQVDVIAYTEIVHY